MYETNTSPPGRTTTGTDTGDDDHDGLAGALDDEDLREFSAVSNSSPVKRGRGDEEGVEGEEKEGVPPTSGAMDYEEGRSQRKFAPRPFRAVQSMPAGKMFGGEEEPWERAGIDAGLRGDPGAW
jgi:hypothetical protein